VVYIYSPLEGNGLKVALYTKHGKYFHMFVVTAFRYSNFLHNVYLFIYRLFSTLSTAKTACM